MAERLYEVRKVGVFNNVDWTTLLVYIGLVLMGWLNIYAASYNASASNIFDTSQEYGKQFIWICTAGVLGMAVFLLDGRFLMKLSYVAYGVVIALLIAVLLFGKEVNGAKSWFGVGSFGIQPSEFAKLATNMMVAAFLSREGVKMVKLKNRLVTILILLVPCGLIIQQPDMGTVLVFVGFVFVLYREGLSGNILLMGLLAMVLAIVTLLTQASVFTLPFTDIELKGQYFLMFVLFCMTIALNFVLRAIIAKRDRKKYVRWLYVACFASIVFVGAVAVAFEEVFSPHQQERIEILLGLEEDPQGAGYNVKQSKTSIGSGGFMGKGYLQGTLTKFKYVPMQSTDFIFCTVGEEWGFIGSFFVVIVFVVLIVRVIFIAERQRSVYTRIYGYGVASIFFMHLCINIGMTIGLAPIIGIPLPFFSYGGSSLWSFTILLFIFLKLDSQRLEVLR